MSGNEGKTSVLVVEDDQILRNLIVRSLKAAQYQVSEAADGQKAIKALEAAPVSIVVTDIIMPDQEGVETIIEIRRRWPDIKIVAMSGGGRIDPTMILGLAQTFGADALLKKPFKPQDLIDVLSAFNPVKA